MGMAPKAHDTPSVDEWLDRLVTRKPADVLVFQNVYDDSVIDALDPSFLPVDGRHNARTEIRETGLFMRMFHSGLYRCAPLSGILSPGFNQKTRIAGAEFLRFIRQNPGYDVYFINPYPQFAYLTYNVWTHGELYHPGLIALAQTLFLRAGYDARAIFEPRDTAATALYSSYWVAGPRFWERYLILLTRLIEAVDAMPPAIRQRYFAEDRVYPDPVPVLSFIFERSFSAFLHMDKTIRALAYPFARDEILRYCDGIEGEIVAVFADIVDEIDLRRDGNRADRALFTALTRLRATAARRGWR